MQSGEKEPLLSQNLPEDIDELRNLAWNGGNLLVIATLYTATTTTTTTTTATSTFERDVY